MANIRVLSEETINQIAAGEVIENPASVVKELIENSIDAKASRIIVEICQGGFQKICVSDDGQGMDYDDLMLCLERHATSKIKSTKDLQSLFTLGFRGEALASIASVSKMEVISCKEPQPFAFSLCADRGKIKTIREAKRKKGTLISIKSLFYPVPARRKFQKSPRISQNMILKVLMQLNLAKPHLEIKCIADGKEIFSTFVSKSCDKKRAKEEVIEKILGNFFLQKGVKVRFEENRCEISGFIALPGEARKTQSGQHLFVNGRAIECFQIKRSIYEGYGTSLSPNHHPPFILYLSLPIEWVDVNVHPQKKEIRLCESQIIEAFIQKSIFTALQDEIKLVPNFPSFLETQKNLSPSWSTKFEPVYRLNQEDEVPSLSHFPLPVIGLFQSYLLLDANYFDSPFFSEKSKGILFVDLKRVSERLNYESFLNRFETKREIQTLMFPVTFEVSKHEKKQIEGHLDVLHKLGISIRLFGENVFVVDAIEPLLCEDQIEVAIHSLVAVLNRFDEKVALQKKEQQELAFSILPFTSYQKKKYSLEEAKALTKQLLKQNYPPYTPAGKPIWIHLRYEEIKKYFCN